MAKKAKKEKTELDKYKKLEDDIIEEFGVGVLTNGQSIVDQKRQVIPVSPGLDIILGGGIVEGSFCVVTGPPKVGKTSMCLDFAGTAQQLQYACEIGPKEGRRVHYASIEGRLKERDLRGIRHLDMDRVNIIRSQPGAILTAENFLDILERYINECPGDIFIIDSFSSLCTAGEKAADIGDRYRADAPLLLARFCRRVSNVIPTNQSIVLGITHRIANQGKGMSQWSEASGQKVQYQVDIKLKATHDTPWEAGDTKIGQDVHWIAEETALNTAPGGKFTSKFRYGYGIDKAAEVVELAVDLGLVTKGGAWFTFPDEKKCQGVDKAADYLKDNPIIFKELDISIKEMMGIGNAST